MKTNKSNLEVKKEQLDIPVVIQRIEEIINEYYVLEKEYKIYTDMRIPYRKEDFTICEPSNIQYRKSAYEKLFHLLNLNIRLWD